MQQDVDLLINFKATVENLHAQCQKADAMCNSLLMRAQDALTARISTFPRDNLDKLDDVKSSDYLPKLILYNKQIYEVLFTYLQMHPCYLINWIQGALRRDVDLFDNHPYAMLVDDDGDIRKFFDKRLKTYSLHEQQMMSDDICFLFLTVFGGMKSCYNSRRAASAAMMIGIKVFEWECAESIKDPDRQDEKARRIDYGLD